MRKVAFTVFNRENEIKDRFEIDIITEIQGVGFKLKLSTIDGDIESIVTKVVQDKQDIKFKIHFIHQAYVKSLVIEQWLEKYSVSGERLALEYNDGVRVRYAEGKVVDLGKTEKDEYDRLVRDCTFKPLTPFFTHISNQIRIENATIGKAYPFKYPYSYGATALVNNTINNPYILDVPVTLIIRGSISEPVIRLIDADGNEYNRVSFPERVLVDGDYIILNSADRKIWGYVNGLDAEDWTAYTDPAYDTFLRAKTGISQIVANLKTTDTGSIIGSWRQYGL